MTMEEIKYKNFIKRRMICRNCGKLNHHIKNCYEPKTSFGIILYKFIDRRLKILLIKRRNTIGFVQFIRGQYNINDKDYILKLINVMTNTEIDLIKNENFLYLWKYLWKIKTPGLTTKSYDYTNSLRKFNIIKNNTELNLKELLSKRKTFYEDQEWGFPKGRKNKQETNIETGIREFTEETGIPDTDIKIINKKFIENYISYDNLEYKNKYFLAKYTGDETIFSVSDNNKEQFTEVSEIKFFEISEAISIIRDYSIKKKTIVNLVETYITKYL
jgi:8-oxo-dGTP pyrophosphatase MutT (NUDIX family)